MTNLSTQQRGIETRVGPLTPGQRLKMISFFVLLPILAMSTVVVVILQAGSLYKLVRYDKHSSPEVAHVTTETAATANELLISFNQRLQEFDEQSREIFGLRHLWLDEDGKRAKTPDGVFQFVQHHEDIDFLELYVEIGQARAKHETTLNDLEQMVDETVFSLPGNASADRVFQAERIVRKQIYNQLKKLERDQLLLNELGNRYGGKKHD